MLNNPVRFNDPTGHVCSDPESEEANNLVCYGSGTTRIGNRLVRGNGAELVSARNILGGGGGGADNEEGAENWPDDPPWDNYPAPIEWETDAVDVLFDPWAGSSYQQAFTDPDTYYAQYYEMRNLSWLAYEKAGLDMRLIVDNATLYGANNPLTGEQASDLMGSLTLRKGYRPYTEFLKALGLGTGPEHITNYEPRFLEGLMVNNPRVLNAVKDAWRSAVADPLVAEMRQLLLQRGPGFIP